MGYKIVYTKPKTVWVSMGILSNTLDSNAYSPNLVNDRNMILNSGMEIYELKDVINGDFITGSTPNYSENIIENGAALLKTVNIYSNYLDDSKLFYISNSVHENRLKRSQLKKGDIILTVIGATDEVVGRAIVYNGYPEKANITQSLCKFGINQKYDNYYISTFINCKYGHSMILQMAASSTRRYINNADLGTLLIPIPSPEIQKYIGDKVRKAEELREEAKRLKKEAEEILDKELGLGEMKLYVEKMSKKKYSWIQNIQLGDRIDGDFYKSTYNYLNKLDNLSRLEKFYKISKKRIDRNLKGQIKYIDLSSVNSIIEPNEYNIDELPSRAQFLVGSGDLIISVLKGSNKISIVPEHLKGSVCSTGFVVINSKSYLTTEYLYLIFTNKLFNMQIDRYSTGSVMSGVNHDDFNEMYIPVISDKQKVYYITHKVSQYFGLLYQSKQLIQEAKQDVEDLIEGNFDMSKVKA